MNEKFETLQEKTAGIAEKCADLVEERIDATEELSGQALRDIYDGIQMLGHIAATLERLSRMEKQD